MDVENKEFTRRNEGSGEARIRSNMHGTLTRKFVDLMGEYQEIQTKCAAPARLRLLLLPHASSRTARPASPARRVPRSAHQSSLTMLTMYVLYRLMKRATNASRWKISLLPWVMRCS